MKDEYVAATAPASSQKDHENTAALVLILAFEPLSAPIVTT